MPRASLPPRADKDPERRMNVFQPPQSPAADQLLELETRRLKILTVANHQANGGSAASCDHLAALFHRIGHRLFAEHMLAGVCRLNGIVGVRAVVGSNVNGLHLRMTEAGGQLLVSV